MKGKIQKIKFFWLKRAILSINVSVLANCVNNGINSVLLFTGQ